MVNYNINLEGKTVLVTGAAGFIGSNLVKRLFHEVKNIRVVGLKSHKQLVPMQAGDVPVTYADTTPLEQDFGFKPNTSLREGLRHFAEWYAKYMNENNA